MDLGGPNPQVRLGPVTIYKLSIFPYNKPMKLINSSQRISLSELKEMAENGFGDLVKAVVDVSERVMVVDAEMHADQEQFLLEKGYKQENIWGINLYPDIKGEDWIEFDSMINLRPSRGNRSRGVDDPETGEKIINIVSESVDREE
jgi:hypothetical protein